MTKQGTLKVLAVVPCPVCFGLQNLTLAFFGGLGGRVQSHFLNTRWSDGEFGRRLDALGIPHSSTWFGMFSRKLDRENLAMTIECLRKLPIAWWDFMRLYFSFRPDIVYLANHHEVILLFPLLICLRRKVICHMHDPPPPNRFQKISFAFWRRAVGTFVCISHSSRERLGQLGVLRKADVVIQNGVEISALQQPRRRKDYFCAMFGWPSHTVIFGITGQILERKGHEDFIDAAFLAHESSPNARFVIGGRGSQEFVDRIRALIAGRRMESYVGICGWLPRSSEFYEGIDVLVLPSRHDEGFGLVVAEAGERAVAAIVTRSGGAVEIVLDGETGIFVDKNSPQSIADAITKLASDMPMRNRLGERARERVEANFNLRVQVDKFFNFLGSITCPSLNAD